MRGQGSNAAGRTAGCVLRPIRAANPSFRLSFENFNFGENFRSTAANRIGSSQR